jgi:hypothetical protein
LDVISTSLPVVFSPLRAMFMALEMDMAVPF